MSNEVPMSSMCVHVSGTDMASSWKYPGYVGSQKFAIHDLSKFAILNKFNHKTNRKPIFIRRMRRTNMQQPTVRTL